MTVTWTDALDTVDWNELSEPYRKAPLGDKPPGRLKTVFTNSMFRRFACEDGVLVAEMAVLRDPEAATERGYLARDRAPLAGLVQARFSTAYTGGTCRTSQH